MAANLIDAYAAILETRGTSVSPESTLPGSKDAIKQEILDIVRKLKASGQLTERMREQCKVSFGMLATFIPDEQAFRHIAFERGLQYEQAIAKVDQSLANEVRNQMIGLFAAGDAMASWNTELEVLFDEFDRRAQ